MRCLVYKYTSGKRTYTENIASQGVAEYKDYITTNKSLDWVTINNTDYYVPTDLSQDATLLESLKEYSQNPEKVCTITLGNALLEGVTYEVALDIYEDLDIVSISTNG